MFATRFTTQIAVINSDPFRASYNPADASSNAIAVANPLQSAGICHSDPTGSGDQDRGRYAHDGLCAICVSHASTAVDAPQPAAFVELVRQFRPIPWTDAELMLGPSRTGLNTQARAPPAVGVGTAADGRCTCTSTCGDRPCRSLMRVRAFGAPLSRLFLSPEAVPTKLLAIAFSPPLSPSTTPASTTSYRFPPSTASIPATFRRCELSGESLGSIRHHKGWAPLELDAVRRFSTLGMASVAILIVSGAINAWILVGSFRGLVETVMGSS
jgi:hypothetical protein